METNIQERNWHLVRNDNGEWISDENVVFLTKQEARSLQIRPDYQVRHYLFSMDMMVNCGVMSMKWITSTKNE